MAQYLSPYDQCQEVRCALGPGRRYGTAAGSVGTQRIRPVLTRYCNPRRCRCARCQENRRTGSQPAIGIDARSRSGLVTSVPAYFQVAVHRRRWHVLKQPRRYLAQSHVVGTPAGHASSARPTPSQTSTLRRSSDSGFSEAWSTSTNGPRETTDQRRWPTSGTHRPARCGLFGQSLRQGSQSGVAHRRQMQFEPEDRTAVQRPTYQEFSCLVTQALTRHPVV